MKSKQLLPLFALFLAAIGCTRSRSSSVKAILPAEMGEVSLLGAGFNSVQGRPSGYRCLTSPQLPAPLNFQGSTAKLRVQEDLSYNQILENMGAEVGITYPVYPGIDLTGTLSFARDNAKTTYSSNLIMTLEVDSGVRSFAADASEVQLSKPVADVISQPEPPQDAPPDPSKNFISAAEKQDILNDMCGNEYVSDIFYGFRLTAAVKVEFFNEYDRKAFGGSLEANVLEGLAKVGAGAEFTRLARKDGASVSVRILQQGGLGFNLPATIFGDKNPTSFFQCSYENRDACFAVFLRVYDYAKKVYGTDKANGEATSIDNSEALEYLKDEKNLVLLRTVTKPYPPIGAAGSLRIEVDQANEFDAQKQKIQQYRSELGQIIVEIKEKIRRIQEMKSKMQHLGQSTSPQLMSSFVESTDKLSKKELQIREVWDACQTLFEGNVFKEPKKFIENAKSCGEKVAAVKQSLEEGGDAYVNPLTINPNPATMNEWCVLTYIRGSISDEDRLTLLQIMKREGKLLDLDAISKDPKTPGQPRSAEEVAKIIDETCQAVQAQTSAKTVFDYSNGIMKSMRPLAVLRQATHLNLANNNIESIQPLLDVGFPSLMEANFDNNLFDNLEPLMKLGASPQNSIRAGSKLIVPNNYFQNTAALWKAGNWEKVDLTRNPISEISDEDLGTAPLGPHELNVCGTAVSDLKSLSKIGHPLTIIWEGSSNGSCPFVPNDPSHLCAPCAM